MPLNRFCLTVKSNTIFMIQEREISTLEIHPRKDEKDKWKVVLRQHSYALQDEHIFMYLFLTEGCLEFMPS